MYRLLLVEDKNSFIISEMLRAYGDLDITIATRGDEAVKFLAEQRFDAMLLDLRLPVLDGFTVMEAARKIDPSLPIVILSAYSDEPTRTKAVEYGAVKFVSKPPNYPKLHQAIFRAIAHSSLTEIGNMAQTKVLESRDVERVAKMRRLMALREQAAKMGIDTPPHIVIEIEDLEKSLGGN